jgi:hypothetical protein
MKTLKSFIVVAALVVLALAPVAAEKKEAITKPRSSEVVLVARIIVNPPIDREFYSHYVSFTAPGVEAKADKSLKGKTPDDSVYLQFGEVGKGFTFAKTEYVYAKSAYFGTIGDIGFLKMPIPKNRQIRLDFARVYAVDNAFLYFDLPLYRGITVPDGANYVYLGTFTYSVKDEFFTVSDISRSDEFDAAAVAVAKEFGDKAQLVRVNLLDLEDPSKKK